MESPNENQEFHRRQKEKVVNEYTQTGRLETKFGTSSINSWA